MDSVKIYMETIAVPEDRGAAERQTYTTAKSSVGQLLELNTEVTDKVKQGIINLGKAIEGNIFADETEVELSFGITGKGNICILSGSSSMGIKVKLKWTQKENIKI